MRLAIMQPYLLPYLGYFQLAASVDGFVIYDNIKYTKRGWINRNRLLTNGSSSIFTLPLRKDSDYLTVRDRAIADTFDPSKLLNQFTGAYAKAPYFDETFELLERIFQFEEKNLFEFIQHSLLLTLKHLNVNAKVVVASKIAAAHSEPGQKKVLSICTAMKAKTYVNPVGGEHLYCERDFLSKGINLRFLHPLISEYNQFSLPFVSHLSIADVLMFNSASETRALVDLGRENV